MITVERCDMRSRSRGSRRRRRCPRNLGRHQIRAGLPARRCNAAVGTALGQANGIQALDRSRQVIALAGDGGFNMLMGEFMTSVHHKLPVKVIIYNNSALGLITLEAESVGLVPFREAIEFPNPDFAALARACGGHGFTARKPDDLMAAIAEALAVDGPAIVDAVVASDEMPNMPHVELEQAGHYAIAKIKEAVLAVTGG